MKKTALAIAIAIILMAVSSVVSFTPKEMGITKAEGIYLSKGWNLISIPPNAVNVSYDGIVKPFYFWRADRKCYVASDTLKPGIAYWVYATRDDAWISWQLRNPELEKVRDEVNRRCSYGPWTCDFVRPWETRSKVEKLVDSYGKLPLRDMLYYMADHIVKNVEFIFDPEYPYIREDGTVTWRSDYIRTPAETLGIVDFGDWKGGGDCEDRAIALVSMILEYQELYDNQTWCEPWVLGLSGNLSAHATTIVAFNDSVYILEPGESKAYVFKGASIEEVLEDYNSTQGGNYNKVMWIFNNKEFHKLNCNFSAFFEWWHNRYG